MVEPISTAAAATAASAASTAPAVSAASQATVPAASTGIEGKMTIQKAVQAGNATATTRETEILRRLAWAMLSHGEMQVVNQSEIVDEFAGPIYTGLAAATPALSSPTAKNSSSLKGDIAGPLGGENVPSSLKDSVTVSPTREPILEKIQVSDKPEIRGPHPNPDNPSLPKDQSAVIALQDDLPGAIHVPQESPFSDKGLSTTVTRMTGEHPAIQQLLDNYYKAPTVKSQLKTDASKIIVERTLIDERVSVDAGGKRTALCLIEEKVVDRKYLEYGHLSDVISEIRHGNIPTIRQVYLAIIDLTDLATLKMFRPVLLKYKLENARIQLRQLSADLERKTLQAQLPEKTSTTYGLGREVKHRSWYKTDHVTERIGHKDVIVEREFDLVALNVRDVCTREMTRSEMDQIMTRRNELVELMGAGDAINRLETTFSPEQIASINKAAMVWTSENILTTSTEYSTDHLFHRYGVDLKGFAGERISTSEKQVSILEQKKYSEYLSTSDNLNLENINTYDGAISKFASMQKTTTLSSDSQMLARYTEPSEGTRFEEGWITYIPGGSIANLGLKADLGAKLNGWDFFWAGVDVATIAIAIVTLGSSSGVTVAGKSAAVAGIKGIAKVAGKVALNQGAKSGAKALTQGGVKVAAKSGAKAAASASAKVAAKHTGKVALSNVGKKVGAKAVAKSAANVAAKTGFKPNARYIKNGFTYLTDKQGRVIKATGKLKNVPGVRSPANKRFAAQLGRVGDEGGHLIPANYGGPGSLINHVPQTRTVNRSVIKRIENEMGRALRAGKNVEYTVMPHYPSPTSLRPDKFTIRYTIDGVQKIRRISNV